MRTDFPNYTRNAAPGSDVITALFARALKRAGYDVVMEPSRPGLTSNAEGGRVVFEGDLWSFHFETQATPTLEVDLSLLLRTGDSCEVLWRREFPDDDTVPLWIGLGCEPHDMVREALVQVEESVLRQLRAPDFVMALRGRDSSSPEPASDQPDHSHEIVASPSWTATDTGEVKATARESDALVDTADIPTADLYERAPLGPPKQSKAPASAEGGVRSKREEPVFRK